VRYPVVNISRRNGASRALHFRVASIQKVADILSLMRLELKHPRRSETRIFR